MKRRRTASWACNGCGCTDDRACPGGCTWMRPGLCSACDGKDVLKPTPIVVEIVARAIRRSAAKTRERMILRRLSGYRRIVPNASVLSLAMVALLGDELTLATDVRCRAEGLELRPMTRVYMGFGGVWAFSLVWHQERDGGLNYTETHRYRINMGKRFVWGDARRRRR